MFGIIFASDPERALREVERALRPGGRALISAWIPAGPIDAMLTAVGRIAGRVTQSAPPPRFPWSDAQAVARVAQAAGLALEATNFDRLAIRDSSPEHYVAAGQDHPMAVALRPALDAAGAAEEARDAMISVLREANEEAGSFRVHSPYVIHEITKGPRH